jgi:hypothetical protein
MANTLADKTIALQFYSALCSDVYYQARQDQLLDLEVITDNLKLEGIADVVGNSFLTSAGFTAGTDGFYYTKNGFGARLLSQTIGQQTFYTIVYRGTDFDKIGFEEAKVIGQAAFANGSPISQSGTTSSKTNDLGDITADVQIGSGIMVTVSHYFRHASLGHGTR